MEDERPVDPHLTVLDKLVLQRLLQEPVLGGTDAQRKSFITDEDAKLPDSGYESQESESLGKPSLSQDGTGSVRNRSHIATEPGRSSEGDSDESTIAQLRALNNPSSSDFEPTVFVSKDLRDLKLPKFVDTNILRPYISHASRLARHPTDVVFITHLLLYFSTSVPSALYLFHHFTYPHALLHLAMTFYYMGTYTLMMHQHIHMRGVLSPRLSLLDHAFPYVLDPLMGHTWNTYYYHHVKHHHVEGNGPADLSSTIRYQRDSPWHFAQYVARFFLLIWIDLPSYFLRKGQAGLAARACVSELAAYVFLWCCWRFGDARATAWVFLVPLVLMRFGLMVGNWGQHALVDEVEPDSDFRSSITLIDVASNRYCYNDGYHTSHHLNPLRHWRDHPAAFLRDRPRYAREHALVFRDIDYLMMTVRLLARDYAHLARCLVPVNDAQVRMSMPEREEMLRRKTRAFTEEEIEAKFGRGG